VNSIFARACRTIGPRASVFGCLAALALPFAVAAQQAGASPAPAGATPRTPTRAPSLTAPYSLQAAGPGASAAPASHAVSIHDFAFDPAEITVAAGDTVIFTNQDAFVHSVTDDHRAWDSAGIPKNRPWKLVVTGPVSYHCSFHPSMRGTLVVD
jgi:plastocyanin